LNVTTRPFPSVAVHCEVAGHATADRDLPPPGFTAIGPDQERELLAAAYATLGTFRSTDAVTTSATVSTVDSARLTLEQDIPPPPG